MIQRQITITQPGGIHALVAQELAAAVKEFASSLYLRHDGRTASASNPISVLALGVEVGARIDVLADGLDEIDALDAACWLLARS